MERIDDLLTAREGDLINNPSAPEGEEGYSNSEHLLALRDDNRIGPNVQWQGTKNIGDRGIGDSQWDDALTYSDVEGDRINEVRAELQPWTDQLANAVTQAVVGEIVGGSIEGVGYLLDWQGMANLVSGDEKEFTNWFSDFGKAIREKTADATQIYEETPGEMNLTDSGYWFKNSVSVASTLSMMLPSMAATKGLGILGRGVSKLAGRAGRKIGSKIGREIGKEAFDVASKMGAKADWMTEGITQAVVSRHIENSMEASGTFEDVYNERMMQKNPETGEFYTDEEARLSASTAAAENYKYGWAMVAQDMLQYLSIGKVFNPVTRQMQVAGKFAKNTNIPQWAKTAADVGGTFLSEAGEEGYQHYIASKAKLGSDLRAGLISQEEYDTQLSDVMSSDEAKTSMLFGGLGGSVFAAVGPKANQAFKSKSKKEFEANASENFNTALAQKNKMFAALQIEKNRADQTGNARDIEIAQDEIILSMVLDGINSDNLEMVMEAIKNGPEMTAEEKAKFEEDNGYEWDAELAKKGADKALKAAAEIQDIHFKNLSKASNKNTDPNIVKSMSRIEYQNKQFSERIGKSKEEQSKRIKDIKYDGRRNQPSDNFKAKKDTQSRILATKAMIERQEKALESSVDKESKAMKSDLIKRHNYELNELEKEYKELSKAQTDQTEAQARADEYAEQVYSPKDEESKGGIQFDIADGYVEELELNDAIIENQFQLTRLNDKEFQTALINKQTKALIDATTDKVLLEDFKRKVEKGDVRGYTKESEKKAVVDQISERLAAIEKEEKDLKAKEISDAAKAARRKKAQDKKKNPKNPPNSTVVVPVVEAIEDENFEEEKYFEEEFAEEQEEALETRIGTGKSIALLDKVGVASAGYISWVHDNLSKIGAKLKYEAARRGYFKADISKMYNEKEIGIARRAKAARSAFKSALKNKTEIPQHVYDNLEIQVFVNDGDKISTFLPVKPPNDASVIEKKRYEENYAKERKNIIDGLLRGEEVTTTVKHTAGGDLKTQTTDGVVAENNIKDLQQIEKSGKQPHIVFSNLDGNLMEMDKTTRNEEFRSKRLTAGKDEDGRPTPYRGGLFVILRKADGTPFPVRLNFLKNTNEQAEVLADLLIDIAVPPSSQKGTPRTLNLGDTLSLLNEDVRAKVEKHMAPEIAFLKGKKGVNDPTLGQIINMFVYVSKQTEGLTSQLYMSGVNLYFGGANNYINLKNKDKNRQELVDFLRDTKRRQLNINMWNNEKDFPGYRDFVFDNKIINTNVVVGESEFQTEDEKSYNKQGGKEALGRQLRRVQVYAAPVSSKVPAKAKPVKVAANQPVKTVVDAPLNVQDVITDDGAALRMSINAELKKKFPGKFLIYDGKSITKLGNPADAMDVKVAMKVVNDMKKEHEEGLSQMDEALGNDLNKFAEDVENSLESKSSETNDTKVSKDKKEDVSSTVVRERRTRGRSIGSGSTLRAKPANSINKKDPTKEDDQKQPKCKE